MIGRTLDHYRIESELGRGGMGIVYEARDLHLGRKVAVKVLPPERVADELRKQRFVHEAKAASGLNHPNIVSIYDIRSENGVHFIVMERVEGKTLDAIIGPKGIPPAQTLDYAAQIAAALSSAHEAGILHRDLKPSNVIVTAEGRVKILDFGLAKLLDQPTPGVDGTTMTAHSFTEDGCVVGTPAYMSPEQAEGRALDTRSDIFSFGSVLYEMAAGKRPFTGESRLSVLNKIVQQDPVPPSQISSSIPPELERVIVRCLRKDPARRFQSMSELKIALEDLRDEMRVGASPARPRPIHGSVWLGASVVLVAVSAFVLWKLGQGAAPPGPPLRATALTTLPGLEYHPSFSPDGNHVVYSWTGINQENTDIYVQQIGAGSPLRLTTDPLQDYNPVWSPDGRWIAFLRGQPTAPTGPRKRELRIIPPLGGADRKVAEVLSQDFFPAAAYLAWSPDSRSIIVTDSLGPGQPDALVVISLDGGEKRPLTKPSATVLADTSPALSPDSNSLVFLRRTTWASGELHVLRLRKDLTPDGDAKRLTQSGFGANYPVWTPDGRGIVFSAKHSLWRIGSSGNDTPVRIQSVGDDAIMPAISRTTPGKPARLAYVRSFADSNFWRIRSPGPSAPSSSSAVLAIASTKVEYHIRFSPDGRKVAFSSERSGEPEIWISDPDGSNAVQLTSMTAVDTNCPAWSPDGRTIAFSSTGQDEFDIYSISIDGGKPRRLTSHPAIDLCPSFSRDGKWMYFSSMRTGDYRLYKMPASGGETVEIASGNVGRAEESPGGDLYYLTVSIFSPLFRRPAAGGGPVKVADGVMWFNFDLSGKGAYYIGRVGSEPQLQYYDRATGKTTTIARGLGDIWSGLTVSPDGKTILYTRTDASADDLMLVENFR